MDPFPTYRSLARPKQRVFLGSEGGRLTRQGGAGKGEFERGNGGLAPAGGIGVLLCGVVVPGNFRRASTGKHDGMDEGVDIVGVLLLLLLLLHGGGGGGKGGGRKGRGVWCYHQASNEEARF